MMWLAALLLSTNTIVQVENHSYRVKVDGQSVRVYQKSVISRVSIERRRQMREAVKRATGCKITDDYWNATVLEGALDCSMD